MPILDSPSVSAATVLLCVSVAWLLYQIKSTVWKSSSSSTPLRGPPAGSLIFGQSRYTLNALDSSEIFLRWAEEYGSAFRVPFAFGSSQIFLSDPKAIAHYCALETTTYVRDRFSRRLMERSIGRGLLWAEGESHKRQRRTLTPAFNSTAVRRLSSVFYDSAYKVKTAWDAMIDSNKSGEVLIDVQSWMNHVSLDTIGIAGFSHDFKTLQGEEPEVKVVLESFAGQDLSILTLLILALTPIFPILDRIPLPIRKRVERLNEGLSDISFKLLAESKKMGAEKSEDRSSVIGLLLKENENLSADPQSFSEEVLSQMRALLVAGYETTSISLTWALIELCKRQDAQTMLREELAQFSAGDPTWEQLNNGLPYLDAVVHEILRIHPPVPIMTRMAGEDDIIPLSTPVRTRDGELVDSLHIAKGTSVSVSMAAINLSEVFWGPDAKEFKPERWLSEDGVAMAGAKEIHGHRHLLTFSDGPRICIGRWFALAEFKAVLCTLIRNFSFELPEGAVIEKARGLLPRPRLAGEQGLRMPLCVRRIDYH